MIYKSGISQNKNKALVILLFRSYDTGKKKTTNCNTKLEAEKMEEKLVLTEEWDKTFPKSDKVNNGK